MAKRCLFHCHYTRSSLAYVEGLVYTSSTTQYVQYVQLPSLSLPKLTVQCTGTWVFALALLLLLLSLAPRTSPSSDRALLGLQPMLIPAILDRKKSRQEQPVLTIASTLLPLR